MTNNDEDHRNKSLDELEAAHFHKTQEEILDYIRQGFRDIAEGKGVDAHIVIAEVRRRLGIQKQS